MKNLIILMLLLFIRVSTAQEFVETNDFETIKINIKQQEFLHAWQIAQRNADEYLGDADFDFLYGIAGLENYHVELAVFAFERVVANKPNWLDAQYYLAKSYFIMQDYHAVGQLCDSLIAQPSLPKPLLLASQKLKQSAEIKLQKQSLYLQQQLSLAGGYDSNINAGIKEDNIYLPFLNARVILDEASKESSDNYLSINYALNGSKSLNQKSKLVFATQANIHQFISETQYNRTSLEASLSYFRSFELFDASFGTYFKPLWFSGDYYRSQVNVNTGLTKHINQQWLISTNMALGKTKNNVNDHLDTNDLVFSASGQYLIGNWRHSAVYSFLDQDSQSPETPHNSSQSNALSFNSLWLINQHWLMSSSINWKRQGYLDLHPFYFTKRVDDLLMLSALLKFKPSTDWSYQFNASFQNNESNLSLFSYQRFDLGFTASLSF